MRPYRLMMLLLICYHSGIAQPQARKSFDTAMQITDKQPEDYLAPLKVLRNIRADTTDQIGWGTWLQAMMTYYSFLGDYKKLLYYSDSRYGQEARTGKIDYDTAFVKQHQFIKAASYITGQAGNYQVVMLNEAHHIPYHRALAIQMLEGFRKAGYTYLAVETLGDSLLNQKPYPDYNTGYYSREPLFGELLRQAIRLGLKIVVYEPAEKCDHKSNDPNYCNNFRDSLMAVNLKKIIDKNPGVKMLVYAGYDHIHEEEEDGWKKMAQYFKQSTGINPFTVDQTRQIEHLYPSVDAVEFITVNHLLHIKEPVIALKDGKPWHGTPVDATILFPEYLASGTHPSFYSIGGLRKRYALKTKHLVPGQFVQAFYANEKPGARIPADQLIIHKGINFLYLFSGTYLLQVKNQGGTLLQEIKAIVR